MTAYIKFASMAFQRTMAYRVEYYTAVINAFLYIFIFTSVWRSLIPEGTRIDGLSRDDMTAYAVLSTLLKVSFGRNDDLISSRVRSGEIAVDLMKPFSLPGMAFAETVGVSLFQLAARALPILLCCLLLFSIRLPDDPVRWLMFLPVYAAAFLIFFAFALLIGSLSFFFTEIFPFWICYYAMITLSSGAIIPLDFFPARVAEVLYWTPFPYLFYFPGMILLGREGPLPYPWLLVRYTLMVASVLGCAWILYRTGIRRLSIAGG